MYDIISVFKIYIVIDTNFKVIWGVWDTGLNSVSDTTIDGIILLETLQAYLEYTILDQIHSV